MGLKVDGQISDWDAFVKGLQESVDEAFDVVAAPPPPQLPPHFQDARTLARAIWEFWVAVLGSDKVSTGMPLWDGLTDEEQDHLAESCQVNVTEPVRKHLEAMQAYLKKTEAGQVQEVAPKPAPQLDYVRTYPCYACGKIPDDEHIFKPGDVCRRCTR